MTGRGSGCLLRLGRGIVAGLTWCGLLMTVAGMAQVQVRPMEYAGVDAAGMATTLPAALRTMAAQAGVIFVGTVTNVRRVEGDGFAAAGVVEVRFAVEQAVYGLSGGSYLLREWGGLFPPGQRGFVVGDRRLMMLHSPGATGLSSPVGGFEGAIPIVGSGARIAATSRGATVAEPMLDLRWIAAKLVRPVVYAGAAKVSGRAEALEEGLPEEERMPGEATASAASAAGRAPTLVHGTLGPRGPMVIPWVGASAPVASVVALLREWQGSERVAR